jgi:sugar phosphate isomerase/epimerase
MMGDGVIDLPRLRGHVDATGYEGPIEVEAINPANAELSAVELMATVRRRFAESS